MLMKYGSMLVRNFSRETALFITFLCSFLQKNANHALSGMILLRGELGRITFDVGSRVREYVRTNPPPPK